MSGINNYFSNNNIFNGTEIPTQGKFDVGDIIVNIGENAEEEPMWMCIEAGEPGVWKVVGKVEDIDLSGYQEKTDENLATESKDLVGAINELFQNAKNGKELIANAIGEPVSADDTFSAMSNDINSLLSTFKTNMMNNGITVESNDKFKSLIEKIKGLTEGGGNRGVQFISGTLGSSNFVSRNMTQTSGNINSVGCFKIPMPNFEPVLIYAEGRITSQACDSPTIYLNLGRSGGYSFSYRKASNVYYTTCYFYKMDRDSEFLYLQTEGISSSDTFDYYIIGVGEDDTTLLDSLKSILAEEGVTTTEEDDMASLITKVDTEFNDKNNEMSSLNTNITLLTNQVNNLTSELAGKVTPAGNAVAANVLSGKTFINSTGQTITGTMANNGTKTITPKASAQTLGAGYYDKVTINGDADLVAANIVSGKNIFGVTGSATLENVAKAGSTYSLMPYYYNNGTLSQMVLSGTFSSFTHMISLFVPLGGTMTVNCNFSAGSSTTTAELKIEQVRGNNSIWSKTLSTSGTTGITVNENVSNLKFGDIIKLSIRTVSGDKGAKIKQPVLKFSL